MVKTGEILYNILFFLIPVLIIRLRVKTFILGSLKTVTVAVFRAPWCVQFIDKKLGLFRVVEHVKNLRKSKEYCKDS